MSRRTTIMRPPTQRLKMRPREVIPQMDPEDDGEEYEDYTKIPSPKLLP